jgi:isocitrate lyase
MTDKEIGEYMTKIGTLGFVWQFITLAGFHVNGYHISQFAKGFQENGMLEYVKQVQRKERESGNELLTHQKWSGAGVIDYVNSLITRNGVTNINSDNSTETQF